MPGKDAQVSYMSILNKIKREIAEGKTLLQFGFLRVVGQSLAMVEPLVVAKFFAPNLFASYALAKMIVFFFLTMLVVSSMAPFIVFANQERAKTGSINKAFSVQVTFLVLSLFVLAVLILLFNGYLAAFAGISRSDLFFVLLAFVGLATKTFVCNLLMAVNERIKNALAELVFGVLSLAFIVCLAVFHSVTLRFIFAAQFAASVILAAVFIRKVDFKLLGPFGLDRGYLRQMFDFTKWVMVGAAAIYFVDWGDNLVLRYYVSMEQIGIYNFACQIFKGVVVLTSIIDNYFAPFVSMNIANKKSMRSYVYSKRPKIFLLGFAIICVLFLCAPYAVSLIYEKVYMQSVGILMVLLVGSVLYLYSVFYIPFLDALRRYKFAQMVNISQAFAKIALALLLVPRMGVYGAALATVAVYAVRAVSYEIYFRKCIKGLFRE